MIGLRVVTGVGEQLLGDRVVAEVLQQRQQLIDIRAGALAAQRGQDQVRAAVDDDAELAEAAVSRGLPEARVA